MSDLERLSESELDYRKELIYKAIEDATNTIRFLDTKVASLFVVIGLTAAFLTGVKDHIYKSFKFYETTNYNHWILILSIMFGLLFTTISICFGFLSIISIDNPINHVKVNNGIRNPLWYVWTKKVVNPVTKKKNVEVVVSLDDYVNNISTTKKTELIKVISFELLKLSYIRDTKLKRSNNAIKLFMYSLIPLLIIGIYTISYYLFYK